MTPLCHPRSTVRTEAATGSPPYPRLQEQSPWQATAVLCAPLDSVAAARTAFMARASSVLVGKRTVASALGRAGANWTRPAMARASSVLDGARLERVTAELVWEREARPAMARASSVEVGAVLAWAAAAETTRRAATTVRRNVMANSLGWLPMSPAQGARCVPRMPVATRRNDGSRPGTAPAIQAAALTP